MQTIAERLKWARMAAGVTTRELAAAAGVSSTYPSAIECERSRNPGSEKLKRLADALGVPFGWLAFGEGRDPAEGSLRRRGASLKGAA